MPMRVHNHKVSPLAVKLPSKFEKAKLTKPEDPGHQNMQKSKTHNQAEQTFQDPKTQNAENAKPRNT